MQLLLGLTIIFLGTQQIAAICHPNTVCSEDRDTITQLDASVLPAEKSPNGMGSRAWYIQPRTEAFNVILAFKNFSSPDDVAVMVISYLSTTDSTTRQMHGMRGDFEMIIKNTIGVVIFVPLHENRSTNFVLNYYSGCQILTSAQDQITYYDPASVSYTQKTCWLINPNDNDHRRRYYFSIRDVNLNPGQEIAIWDVHTTNLIASAPTEDSSETAIAAQPYDYATILIDLICTRNECRSDSNSFIVSYYAMTQADLNCQIVQRECYERKMTPDLRCNSTCPAFDNMIIEEYGLQASGNFTAIVRSGSGNQNSVGGGIESGRCPWGKRHCDCLHSGNPRRFCNSKLKCFKSKTINRFCVFACVYHKMTTCLRIKILSSIVLL